MPLHFIKLKDLLERMSEPDIPISYCPTCSCKVVCSKNLINDSPPAPKDIALCGNCGTLLAYNDILVLEAAPNSILDDIHPVPRDAILAVQASIKERGWQWHPKPKQVKSLLKPSKRKKPPTP